MRSRAGGFTLLEVMVAVAILSVGLAAVSGALGMVVRSLSVSAGYERAQRVASNQLVRFLAGKPTSTAKQQGVDDGVQWLVRASPDPVEVGLLRVSVEAHFHAAGTQRAVVLETRQALPIKAAKAQTAG